MSEETPTTEQVAAPGTEELVTAVKELNELTTNVAQSLADQTILLQGMKEHFVESKKTVDEVKVQNAEAIIDYDKLGKSVASHIKFPTHHQVTVGNEKINVAPAEVPNSVTYTRRPQDGKVSRIVEDYGSFSVVTTYEYDQTGQLIGESRSRR